MDLENHLMKSISGILLDPSGKVVRISELTFLADSGILALALVTAYVSATVSYPANFSGLFRAYHTDCLILDTPSWHLWGNSLDAPLSSGPDIDNFLLDAFCWYGRHYGSSLHPLFFCFPQFPFCRWIPAEDKQVCFEPYT